MDLGGPGGPSTLLGADDTDSLSGGCTTHVAVRLVLALGERLGLALLDHPGLVRLNPSNPWKTRGNAAICLRLGRPRGPPTPVGMWRGEPIMMCPWGEEAPPSDEALAVAWEVVESLTWPEDGRTNPGLVLAGDAPPADWYREALHGLLGVEAGAERVRRGGLLHQASGTGRGLIGATSAVAWPCDPHTWELLAYRPRERWGTPREVEVPSVRAMEDAVPTTFDSFDGRSGAATMVPSSPCPVLFGIRGTEPGDLPGALDMIRGEAPEGWLVFRTNQGTDDHLIVTDLAEARPYENVAVRGTVLQGPATIPGGHVLFPLGEDGARLDVAAYEPTKGFRTVVRQLRAGDRIVACGSVREEPRTLNLEKLRVLSLGGTVERAKVANPRCPKCGKGMKSVGTEAGYRCPRCGARAGEDEATFEDRRRTLELGWHEVPTSARRHLARPLKLGVRPDLDGIDG